MTTRTGHYRPSFETTLTAKQRRVIALMERGKTNYEIAQELGVSLEGAKYHVSEILGKLGVSSREEAVAAWQQYNSAGSRLRRAMAVAPISPLIRAALAAAVIVPVAVIVAVILATRGGDGNDGVTPDQTATPSPAPGSPTSPATASPSAQATPTATATAEPALISLTAYFMRGEDVGPVLRQVPETQAVARAAIEELLAGPSQEEAASGLTSSVPSGTRLLSISITNAVATIDLSGEFVSGGGTLSMRSRLAQVVYTLTQFPTVDGVAFRIDGVDTTVFGGEGIILPSPAGRAEFEDVTPQILLDSPAQGATITSPVRLIGTANTFEATFHYTILDDDGNELADDFAMATSGTGTRGTFEITADYDDPATETGIIRVFEFSAQDGSPINVVEVPVRFER